MCIRDSDNSAAPEITMERSSALVGEASLTVNGVGSSELYPLMPVGAADKKIKNGDDNEGAMSVVIVVPVDN
ncbi:MAG: hypothetical protein MPK62_12705, partial [Alphaproteobacteria bacterium]|nr:hypothetical protein [Alphaproteobacteria bacterium]